MIALFTDFGLEGPYTGQMQAVLHREAPGVPVVSLFSDLPPFDSQGAAYLLAAYAGEFPLDTVFLCVVDPGVGGPRAASILRADGRWYVGPDNGLLAIAARRAGHRRWWDVSRRPARLSASFHGRDLFAPVAARLARGEPPLGEGVAAEDRLLCTDWPDDLSRVVYVDRFGNAMTGLRAAVLGPGAILEAGGRRLGRARTFSDVAPGEAFWYENANGLAEIAVNTGRADRTLGIAPGDSIHVIAGGR